MSRRLKIVVVIGAFAAAAVVGGPWVYINVFREPAPESFLDQASSTSLVSMSSTSVLDTTSATAAVVDPTGVWNVTSGSQVGYRVNEVLFGQKVTAVGRTSSVTGTITIENSSVTTGEFIVDMTTVRSDEPKRDAQFESRIMDVINYPSATFVLTSPIPLPADAAAVETTYAGEGDLTLRGVTKRVPVSVVSEIRAGSIVVSGEVTITFADWSIPNPSIPGISTEDFGVLEFQLQFGR